MNRWLTVTTLALLALGIGNSLASAGEFSDDVMAGMRLTDDEAESLEARLETDPSDVRARKQLIAYYFHKALGDPAIRRTRNQHVLWLIRNAPQADVLGSPHAQIQPFLDGGSYDAGKSAWLNHIEREPTSVALVGHAANFFSPLTDRELVIETLQKAHSLDPEESRWPTLLGHQYRSDALFGGHGGESSRAVQALEQFTRAHQSADGIERTGLLVPLAKAAFMAERYDDARAYAATMLEEAPSGWDEGNQLHHGNLILGRIALLEDDVEQAKHHLLEAGKVSGSPQLGSFGPNMRLAADLLDRGERDVVLEYLELCSNFWPRGELEDWAALVQAGRIPDFGANLVY